MFMNYQFISQKFDTLLPLFYQNSSVLNTLKRSVRLKEKVNDAKIIT